MSARFVPCRACARHVNVNQSDCTCPFCEAKVLCSDYGGDPFGEGGGTPTRMSRAGLIAAGAVTAVLSATACGASSTTPVDGAAFPPVDADAGDAHATLGPGPELAPEAGPNDRIPREGGATPDAGAHPDAGNPPPRPMPLYGGPPPIDSPESPGGRSEPVDNPRSQPGAVVRSRKPRRKGRVRTS